MSSIEEIKSKICDLIAAEVAAPADEISSESTFHELGLDSVNSLFLLDDLERFFNMDIDPLSLYDNPTIASFSAYLYDQMNEGA